MEASDEKLKTLHENSGVDFIALRKKYSAVKSSQEKDTSAKQNIPRAPNGMTIQEQFDSLDKYEICKRCGGEGIIKEIYNHMVMQKTCPECDGESIMQDDKYLAMLNTQNADAMTIENLTELPIETVAVESLD